MKQKLGATTTLLLAIISATVILASCVTVHVNFPEGAVQKAASDYVEELYKAKKAEEETTPEPSSSLVTPSYRGIASLFVAEADALQFQMNSPKTKAILAKQKGRLNKVLKYKKKGILGETDQGLLAIKDLDKVSSAIEKKRVQNLVKQENEDRNALYKEIIASNKLDGSANARLRGIFFKQFKAADPSGSPYKAGGSWKTK